MSFSATEFTEFAEGSEFMLPLRVALRGVLLAWLPSPLLACGWISVGGSAMDKPNQDAPGPDIDDLREPTKEELLEDLRVALKDTIAGKEGLPAREAIEAMRKRIYGDSDES